MWWWFSHSVMSNSCNPMDCSPPGSSVHRISQATILEWVAISFSRGSSNPRIKPASPTLAGGFFTTEPPGKPQTLKASWTKKVWKPQSYSKHFPSHFLSLWPCNMACRILVSLPRSWTGSWAVEAQSPNHWTANSHVIFKIVSFAVLCFQVHVWTYRITEFNLPHVRRLSYRNAIIYYQQWLGLQWLGAQFPPR